MFARPGHEPGYAPAPEGYRIRNITVAAVSRAVLKAISDRAAAILWRRRRSMQALDAEYHWQPDIDAGLSLSDMAKSRRRQEQFTEPEPDTKNIRSPVYHLKRRRECPSGGERRHDGVAIVNAGPNAASIQMRYICRVAAGRRACI